MAGATATPGAERGSAGGLLPVLVLSTLSGEAPDVTATTGGATSTVGDSI